MSFLGHFWAIMSRFWPILGHMGPYRVILGHFFLMPCSLSLEPLSQVPAQACEPPLPPCQPPCQPPNLIFPGTLTLRPLLLSQLSLCLGFRHLPLNCSVASQIHSLLSIETSRSHLFISLISFITSINLKEKKTSMVQ